VRLRRTAERDALSNSRTEADSLGPVEILEGKLWGAQTHRAIEHFNIGRDLMPGEMIAAYAIVKRAAAKADHDQGRLGDKEHRLITQVCDEILVGGHRDMFPLHVWMSGSGTQFNMNVNEVIANRCAEIEGLPLSGKRRLRSVMSGRDRASSHVTGHDAQSRRARTRLRDGGGIRPPRRPGEDDKAEWRIAKGEPLTARAHSIIFPVHRSRPRQYSQTGHHSPS